MARFRSFIISRAQREILGSQARLGSSLLPLNRLAARFTYKNYVRDIKLHQRSVQALTPPPSSANRLREELKCTIGRGEVLTGEVQDI